MSDTLLGKYEAVIGLEIHAQLATQSKLFCADNTIFGAAPNTQISAITLAHPGTLPKINKKAVEYAVKLGLACNCAIAKYNYFARKNYFYPDLPKGWQTSQHTHPICIGGTVLIKTENGKRAVKIHHIHLEEDAGKSIHDIYDDYTCVDLNRAGMPLVEIVSDPDMHTADEAWQYVNEIRKLVRWLGVCDGNMEEGSLRCDANISIRLKGETKLGTRVEVKNLNSTRNIKKAIEYEIERMVKLVEAGAKVQQQTRSFDASTDTTFSIRDKEEANDYRYFPEPDLAPLNLCDEYINSLKASLPALPNELADKYQSQFKLSEYDTEQLCSEKEIADFFESVLQYSNNYKAVANWINGPIRSYINEQRVSFTQLSVTPKQLADLIVLIDEGKINFSVASSQIFPELLKDKNATAINIATYKNLLQTGNDTELQAWIAEAISRMPDKVKEYQKGKKGLIGLFVGEVKKLSKGKADPKKVTELLQQELGS
ncbi:MAG TPA: Asp-tRNA(Asn)/Glu-tRNA(Gln) amidotransferase subunit GatB [Arachidicoccus sp.]